MEDLSGQTIDGYEIIRRVGHGGVGVVYEAREITLNRRVALKVMHDRLAQRADFQQRFLQEAQIAARLEHPRIVRVYRFNQEAPLYLAMEFVEGQNLRQRLRTLQAQNQPMALSEVLALVYHVCEALTYAHQQNIIHGDIKPENIILKNAPLNTPPYEPLITDFGLARLMEGNIVRQAENDKPAGTPIYASPEQALQQRLDARSDIYSLGIMLYELVVGQRPFAFENFTEAIAAHTRNVQPPYPRVLNPNIPEAIEKVILRAIAKAPEDRFVRMTSFCEALSKELSAMSSDVTVVATPPPPISKGQPLPTDVLDDTHIAGATDDTSPTNQPIDLPPAPEPIDLEELYQEQAPPDLAEIPTPIGEQKTQISTTPEPNLPDEYPTVLEPEPTVAQAVALSDNYTPPRLELEEQQLSITPGDAVTLTVKVANTNEIVEHFIVDVREIPGTWVHELPPPLYLLEGQEQQVHLTIRPPREPSTEAKVYRMIVRAASEQRPDKVTERPINLTILPFYDFTYKGWPEKLSHGQRSQVTVYNLGNIRQEFVLRAQDADDDLVFTPSRRTVSVEPGQEQSVNFEARPQRRPVIGPPQTCTFNIEVESQSSEAEVERFEGTFENRRRPIEWLILPVMALLCLSLTGAAFYLQPVVPTPPPTLIPVDSDVAQAADPFEFMVLSTDQTIKQGGCVTLQWKIRNAELVALNGMDINPNSDDSKEVCPKQTTKYTWAVTKLGVAEKFTKMVTITVQPLEKVTFDFETFPSGTTVLGPVCILLGDEYNAKGVNLCLADKSVNCGYKQPSVAIKGTEGEENYLTVIPPNWHDKCKTAPLAIQFLETTRVVTLTYQGELTQTYRVLNEDDKEIIESGDFVVTNQKPNISFRLKDRAEHIKQVIVGLDQAKIEITNIAYEFMPDD